ncbi:MAG: 7-carboxy-7-deazaguanine synthase QueE [Crocinitomix sp.]|nr:7-carboxy-7-deazaguanine synthase QueE [Crocinitomix sp.]
MSNNKIPLMQAFFTIQGEGFHSGRAAYFIRTAGCDVGCVWCDVKESWDENAHTKTSISDIVDGVKASRTDFVVITGGEPTMYDLTELTRALKEIGMEIAIETSGAYTITGEIDWICLSPKKFKFPLEENYTKADELKMIIFNKSDFNWAAELKTKVKANCKLYLQTEWDKSEQMLPLIIDYVKLNTDWNISLQTHKFLNIP